MSDYGRKCLKCNTYYSYLNSDRICQSCEKKIDLSKKDYMFLKDVIENLPKANEELKKAMKEVKPSTGKPPISLIPREAIEETAKAFDYGSSKHGRYAFREGVEYTKLIDAALRHLLAVADGEDTDAESGNLHAASVIANMSMLLYMMKNKPEFDDRYKK